MSAPDYTKQSERKRPGEPYQQGDIVTNRRIDSIVKMSKYLDKIHYKVIFEACGHSGIASHKTLTRAEISGKAGTCRECLRLAREKKVKTKKERVSTWPPHPDRELHLMAHRLFTKTIRGIAL